MSRHYSDPDREKDPHALPDIEVFYLDATEAGADDESEPIGAGWFYAFGFPGCLHDSDPVGPYPTEAEALAAAREGNENEGGGSVDGGTLVGGGRTVNRD